MHPRRLTGFPADADTRPVHLVRYTTCVTMCFVLRSVRLQLVVCPLMSICKCMRAVEFLMSTYAYIRQHLRLTTG